jgi:hypothetical protein
MTNREALRNANQQYSLAQAESRRWQCIAQVSDKQEDWNMHIAAQKDVLHWATQAQRHDRAVAAGQP